MRPITKGDYMKVLYKFRWGSSYLPRVNSIQMETYSTRLCFEREGFEFDSPINEEVALMCSHGLKRSDVDLIFRFIRAQFHLDELRQELGI